MKRRILFCLGALLCVPAIADAITITAGTHFLDYNQAGQEITITLSGASATETYGGSDLRTLIAAGGPVISHVFADTGGMIPGIKLIGSIWEGGQGGIAHVPDGTAPADGGQRVTAGFETPAFSASSTNGTYAVLTIDTRGITPGTYAFSLSDHPNGPTTLLEGVDEVPNGVPVENLELVNGFLVVTPEPGSVVMGLFAVAWLAAIAFRRRLG